MKGRGLERAAIRTTKQREYVAIGAFWVEPPVKEEPPCRCGSVPSSARPTVVYSGPKVFDADQLDKGASKWLNQTAVFRLSSWDSHENDASPEGVAPFSTRWSNSISRLGFRPRRPRRRRPARQFRSTLGSSERPRSAVRLPQPVRGATSIGSSPTRTPRSACISASSVLCATFMVTVTRDFRVRGNHDVVEAKLLDRSIDHDLVAFDGETVGLGGVGDVAGR